MQGRIMKKLAAAALAAVVTLAPAAYAQDAGDYAGTWAFQTQDYGNQQFSVTMSGVAIMTPAAPGRFDIRLVANELITQRGTGRSQLLTARQACVGETDGPQFSITCQMAEPLEGYEPDNFLLQSGERDQLIGVLNSATSGQVTFTRVR